MAQGHLRREEGTSCGLHAELVGHEEMALPGPSIQKAHFSLEATAQLRFLLLIVLLDGLEPQGISMALKCIVMSFMSHWKICALWTLAVAFYVLW